MKKWFVILFSILLLGFGLAACNGITTSTTTAGTTTTSSQSTTTSTTTQGTTITDSLTTEPTTASTTDTTTSMSTLENVVFHYYRADALYDDYALVIWAEGEDPVQVDFAGEDFAGAWYEMDLTSASYLDWDQIEFKIIEKAQPTASYTEYDLDETQEVDFTIHAYIDGDLDEVDYTFAVHPINVGYIIPVVTGTGPSLEETFLIDDFTRSAIDRDGVSYTGDVALSSRVSYLEVEYDTTTGVTTDDAIYKSASGANTSGSYLYLVFVMKGLNGASIDDLKLGFRLDDNHEVLVRDFTQLVDPDAEPLPELTEDYQVYIISIPDSLDGLTFIGITADDVAAGGSIVGFHLMADGLGTGTIVLEEIYYSNNAVTQGSESADYLIDDFQRENVNQKPFDSIYWCGSVGEIIGKWLLMDATTAVASYEDKNQPVDTYENLLLRLRSDVAGGDVTITPVYDDNTTVTYGTGALLSTLLDPEEEAIGTIGTEFATVVINFAANSWSTENLVGFKFELASGMFTFDKIEYKTYITGEEPDYPTIDPESFKVFDNFGRDTLGATAIYDPNNPVAAANDLYYIITYTNSEELGKLYIEDGAVVFDCTENGDYINFVEASQSGNLGTHKYVVFKMKTDEGGSIDNFRFTNGSMSEVWGHSILAAPGMLSKASPYVSPDGWTYLVVDLELNGLNTSFEELVMFYSGSGRLLIDSIFFANDDFDRLDLEGKVDADNLENPLIIDAEEYTYRYLDLTETNIENQRYLVMVIRGTGLENFRFETHVGETNSALLWLKDAIGVNGYNYDPEDFSATEYRYFIIDLVANNLQLHPEGIHLHLNNAKVYIADMFYADTIIPMADVTPEVVYSPEEPLVIDASALEYLYTYVGLDYPTFADYLVITIKGELSSLRIQSINYNEEFTSDFIWIHNMKGINGAPLKYLPSSTEYQVLVIDMVASGLGNNIGGIHVHYGDATATDIITISEISVINLPDTLVDWESADRVYVPDVRLPDPVFGVEYGVANGWGSLSFDSAAIATVDPDDPDNTVLKLSYSDDTQGFSSFFRFLTFTASTTYNISIDFKIVGTTDNMGFRFAGPVAGTVVQVYNHASKTEIVGKPGWYNVQFTYDSGTDNFDSIALWFNTLSSQDNYALVDNITVKAQGTETNINAGGDFEGFLDLGIGRVIDASAIGYVYNWIDLYPDVSGERYLILEVKGGLVPIRFEAIKADASTVAIKWIHELIGVDGKPLVYMPNANAYQTLIIDLVASGIGTDIASLHFHYGDDTDKDVLEITKFMVANMVDLTADFAVVLGD